MPNAYTRPEDALSSSMTGLTWPGRQAPTAFMWGRRTCPWNWRGGFCCPGQWVGVSTHTRAQMEEAEATSADYIAFGPIFATRKQGTAGSRGGPGRLREMRGLTRKPLVAIGGITLDNAASVIEAGADSVAVIHDLLAAEDIGARARKFLQALG